MGGSWFAGGKALQPEPPDLDLKLVGKGSVSDQVVQPAPHDLLAKVPSDFTMHGSSNDGSLSQPDFEDPLICLDCNGRGCEGCLGYGTFRFSEFPDPH